MVQKNETEHQDVNTCYKSEPRIEVPIDDLEWD